MPAEKKKNARLIRLLVPALVLGMAIGFVYMVFSTTPTSQRAANTPADSAPESTPESTPGTAAGEGGEDSALGETQSGEESPDTTESTTDEPDAAGPDSESSSEPTTGMDAQPSGVASAPDAAPTAVDLTRAAAVLDGLRARDWGPIDAQPTPLGSIDPGSAYRLLVELSWFGGGIERATAGNYFYTIEDDVKAAANPAQATGHYVIQEGVDGVPFIRQADQREVTPRLRPYAAVSARLVIGDVDAGGASAVTPIFGGSTGRHWRELEPGVLQAELVNAADEPVARITRTFTLPEGSYEVGVTQTIENLTDQPLQVVLEQDGPINLIKDTSGYRIPLRRVRLGHYLPPTLDASQTIIQADEELRAQHKVLSAIDKGRSRGEPGVPILWPSDIYPDAASLAWYAQSNRYFIAAVHTPEPPGGLASADVNPGPIEGLQSIRAEQFNVPDPNPDMTQRIIIRSITGPIAVGPRSSADASFGAYIGPMNERYLRSDAQVIVRAINLADVVVYNLGGPCAFCTLQWIARPLLAVLRFFEGIVGDWAISIILLVVCVRACLHPITRKGQISLMKTGKGMQRIKPKMDKLKERYGKDPKRMQQEMMKLYREEGVNPAGMLGCLPMLLQSPIWIALYAMLYMSFDLRHEAAFYGVFQTLSGGNWTFMADLARGDGFIPFGTTIASIPLFGDVIAFNILPILLGVVFYLQQKYMTAQNTSMMTPEQQAQQRIIRVVMVVMFPVLMYNAPAALTLYFVTNSTLGILESRWIRAHIDTLELDKAPSERSDHAMRHHRKRVKNQANPFGQHKGSTRNEQADKRFKKRK